MWELGGGRVRGGGRWSLFCCVWGNNVFSSVHRREMTVGEGKSGDNREGGGGGE